MRNTERIKWVALVAQLTDTCELLMDRIEELTKNERGVSVVDERQRDLPWKQKEEEQTQ